MDKAVYISDSANNPEKVMNPIITPPVMGK